MTGRLGATAIAAAGAVCLAACGAAPGSSPGQAPTAAPKSTTGPRVLMPSGAAYAVELARTPDEQAQGLMFRENLPPNTGMLFLFDEAAPHQFWMKNTMIALDLIWMDESGRVLYVSGDTPPCKADPCPTYGPDVATRKVLEIAGGRARREGVTVGATLKISGIRP